MSGIRKCAECGGLFRIENAGPEPMRFDGTFPRHVCPKCRAKDEEPESSAQEAPKTGSRWQHFKRDMICEVVGLARCSETQDVLVLYQEPGDGGIPWARPLKMWHDEIDRDGYKGPRFTQIEDRA